MRTTGFGGDRRTQRGMVTAELAVATLAALATMLLLSWGVYLMVMQGSLRRYRGRGGPTGGAG